MSKCCIDIFWEILCVYEFYEYGWNLLNGYMGK